MRRLNDLALGTTLAGYCQSRKSGGLCLGRLSVPCIRVWQAATPRIVMAATPVAVLQRCAAKSVNDAVCNRHCIADNATENVDAEKCHCCCKHYPVCRDTWVWFRHGAWSLRFRRIPQRQRDSDLGNHRLVPSQIGPKRTSWRAGLRILGPWCRSSAYLRHM